MNERIKYSLYMRFRVCFKNSNVFFFNPKYVQSTQNDCVISKIPFSHSYSYCIHIFSNMLSS